MRAPDRKPAQLVVSLTLVALAAPAAAAEQAAAGEEEAPSYEAVVTTTRVDDGLDSQRRLDRESHGFATAIEVDRERTGMPSDALPELVARVPGANVRSIGGLGQFSSLSLRGSTGQQVTLFLDGVPLGNSLGGLVSLADVPLDALETVEVYRGFIPIGFGGATIGGAVNLVGRVYSGQPRLQSRSGLGSFGARDAEVTATTPLGENSSVVARMGYARGRGDFLHFDDGRTPEFRGDDGTSVRSNNGFRRLFGQARIDGRRGLTRYSVQQLALWKDQGIAGMLGAPARRASLDSIDLRNIASLRRPDTLVPGGRLSLLASLGYQRRRFHDPDNDVGLAQNDQVTAIADAYLSPRFRMPLWRDAFGTLILDGRYERADVENRLPADPTGRNPSGDAQRWRGSWGGGVQVEQYLWDLRLVLAPILRVDLLDSHFAVAEGQGEQDDAGRDERRVALSPRLGTRLRALDWLELRASAGRYFRSPTLMELFGDQGWIVGNEGLLPERGTAVDAGVLVDTGPGGKLGAYAQAAAFATWSEDLIHWVLAGQSARPINIQGARTAGVELGAALHAWGQRLTLHGSYTFVDSINHSSEPAQTGQPLPGRPRHSLFARIAAQDTATISGHAYRGRLYYETDYVAGTYLDASGRLELPAYALHGAGVEVEVDGSVRIAFSASNLFDRRTTTWAAPVRGAPTVPVPIGDFIRYPLPGRSLWLGLSLALDPTSSDPRRSGAHDA